MKPGRVAGSAQLIPVQSGVGEDLAPPKPGRIAARPASATSWNHRSQFFTSQLLGYLELEPPEKCHFAGDTTSAPAVCAQTICRGKKKQTISATYHKASPRAISHSWLSAGYCSLQINTSHILETLRCVEPTVDATPLGR